MIFKLFPSTVYEKSFDVAALPMELAVLILRNLEADDLFNAAKVNREWLNICLFDQVLRRRLKAKIEELKRRNFEILAGIRKSVTVIRAEQSNVYGCNAMKTVRVKDVKYQPYQRCALEDALKSKKGVGRRPMKGARDAKRCCRI